MITETNEQMLMYTKNDWHSGHHLKVIKYLKKCDIYSYVDLGANLGEVCNILKFHLPELKKAYLFEPQLDNFAFMNERYKHNPEIKCINYGIFYGAQILPFYRKNKNIHEYTIVQFDESYKLVGETTFLRTLEEFDLPIVDYIKIDVEGSEENIIKNSKYIPKIKYIDIQFHDQLKNSDIIEKLCLEHFPKHKIVFIDNENVFLEKQESYLSFKL